MHNYCLSNPKYKTAVFMLIADDDARDHANREKALDLGKKWHPQSDAFLIHLEYKKIRFKPGISTRPLGYRQTAVGV